MKRFPSLIAILVLCLLLAGCGQRHVSNSPLDGIRDEIIVSLGSADPVILNEKLLFTLYGIEERDYTEMGAYQAMWGIFPDECIMVRATEDGIGRVQEALQSHLDSVLAQSANYDPETNAVARKCRVSVDGQYVSLFLSASHERMEELYRSHFDGSGPVVTPVPTPEPTPEPEPSPEPTPEPTPEPVYGLVHACDPVDESWFDDVIFVGDSVEFIFSRYMLYYQSSIDPASMANTVFFTASNFSYRMAATDLYDISMFPAYEGVNMRVEDAVQKSGAKKLYIGMGPNDIAFRSIDQVDKTMEYADTVLRRVRENNPDVQIFLMAMTPRPAGHDGECMNNALIQKYNAKLLAYAEGHQMYFIDLFEALSDESGCMPMEWCTDPDKAAVHPSYPGCEAWRQYLYTHVPG